MNRLRITLLPFTFFLLAFASANAKTIYFTKEIAEDATLAVLTKILAIEEEGITEVKFEKGTYHFYPDKAFEVYRHISNHDNQLTRTPFPLMGLKNLSIDGQGSTFVFHGVQIPFLLDKSENIRIKNLSVDWAMPFHSEATIVAQNAEEHTYDIRISEEYPYVIRNGNLVFLKEYYEHTVGQMYIFDPKTGATVYQTQDYSTWYSIRQDAESIFGKVAYKYPFSDDKYDPKFNARNKELKSHFEELEPGLVRVYNHSRQLPPIGTVMVMKGAKGVNRTSPAFHLVQTTTFAGENIYVLHAGGMGIIAENCTDIRLDSFNVIPSEGRMVSATADATHFIGCRGKLEILNSTFTNQLDDGTNIHGAYQEVVDVIDEYTLGIRTGHFQQKGFKLGLPGDEIGIIKKDKSIFPIAKLTLKSLKMLNGAYCLLTFNEKLPNNLEAGDLLENQNYPEVLIENCNFSKNRARGVLIASTKKSLIRNCYFHNEMEAMLFPGHMGHWYESGHAANVLIEGNTMIDCGFGGTKRGVIRFNGDVSLNEYTFKNIRIVNNKIERYDNLILDVNCVDGLVFEGNTITNSGNFPAQEAHLPAIRFQQSKNIHFEGNKYLGKAKVLIETDSEMVEVQFK